MVYHVLNRANGRLKIFRRPKDYEAFEQILLAAKKKQPMRLLAYCLMPNHWHLILYPYADGDLSNFMRWVTLTHTQRWHTHYQSVGYGHLYQGRFKSFPVQKDEHFLQLVRYVERNAQRAALVNRADDWPWSSLHRREYGSNEQKKLLSSWPVQVDHDFRQWVNIPQPQEELAAVRFAIKRSRPYGQDAWLLKTVAALGLETTMRQQGGYRRNEST
ncbi:MAG: transposase [Candidatus Andersenbacteria bacterium]|nr:transposase [Candidatus Andersenbacteria bacterium]